MGAQPLGREVVAEAEARRVVGDRQVLVARVAGRDRHLLDRGGAVGRGRVAVQVAAQIGDLDQLGQRPDRRRLELAAVLAQLGLDVVQPEQR